jgi:thioredoxin reductase
MEQGSGALHRWSRRISEAQRERLALNEIPVREEPIVRLEGDWGRIAAQNRLCQRRGAGKTSDVLQHRRAAEIPLWFAKIGCELDEKGRADTGDFEESNVPGLYIVGDASDDVQFAIVAAAEGARASVAIKKAMLREASPI